MAQIFRRTTRTGDARYDVRTRIGGRVVTRTFKRKRDAEAYATSVEADRLRGVVIDPRRARVTLATYGRENLRDRRPGLALRTADQYSWLLEQHILPELGKRALGDIDPAMVRSWNARLAERHPTTAAKAYRLLSSIMRAAVADEVVTRNPCQVKGAAVERSAERPVASIAEVTALAEAMPDHLQVAVLLGAWCQLRRGELLGLRRRDIDLNRGTLTVELTRGPRMGGEEIIKAPKTDAGRRTVAIPGNVLPLVERHLEVYVGHEPDAPFLVGEMGHALLVKALNKAWSEARSIVGRTDLRLHDLRHSGLTWAAATGASVAELMRRAGHKSPVAALHYQHATDDRDRVLAEALAELGRRAVERPTGVSTSDGPEPANQTLSSDVPRVSPRDGRAMEGDEGPEDRSQWAVVVPLTRKNDGGDDGTRTRDPLLAKQVL
jgi:integrase